MTKEDLNIATGNTEDKWSKRSAASQVLHKAAASRVLCASEEESAETKREV